MRAALTLGVLFAAAQSLAAQDVFYQEVSWSPDGEWLGFTEVTTGDPWTSTILVMRPNGKDVRPIPHGLMSARWTSWHPQGRLMAFAGEVDKNWEIFVIDLESDSVTRLTNTATDEAAPSWSPDGSQLVFTARVNERSQVFRMNADGTGRTNLSQSDRNEWHPSWSPTSDEIVFYASQDTTADHLFLMRSDGADRRQLTSGHLHDVFPGWSADGSMVVFSRNQTGTIGVYQMSAGGSVPEEVAAPAFYGRISPDGKTVAFIRGEWPKSAIYVGEAEQKGDKYKRIRH